MKAVTNDFGEERTLEWRERFESWKELKLFEWI